jgi:TetR/AcrR family transcriptional regulator, mexJK operon transcriptional repressor
MKHRVETRSDRKHKAILEAATQAFLSKGYLGTNMDEIATLAGVSKRTVYQHFVDKERLFTEIVLATPDRVEELGRMVDGTVTGAGDLRRELEELARRFLATFMDPALIRLRRVVIASADMFPELGRIWYEQGFMRGMEALAGCFRSLRAQGRLQIDDPLLAANHFAGLLLWVPVNYAMFTGDDRPMTQADLGRHAEAAVRSFLDGHPARAS